MNKEEFFIMMHEFENANDENKSLLDSLRKSISEAHSQNEEKEIRVSDEKVRPK